jgi:formylmethanofuran dehydrogenase subunit E
MAITIECKGCGEMVDEEDMTETGLCIYCQDEMDESGEDDPRTEEEK